MIRLALLILIVFAVLWMAVPMGHSASTEIGFLPGDPDPNVYTSTLDFGGSLSWISWESSRNEAAGYHESEFHSFHPLSFTVHILLIVTPLLLLYLASRAKARDTA